MLDFGADTRMLGRVGLDVDVLDSGCCGMAGSFGFEARHYNVSMAVGERVLLPAVRRAAADTLVVADGFSCREQIAQATDRRALHLADVLAMAVRRERGVARAFEFASPLHVDGGLRRPVAVAAALLGAGALAVSGTLLWHSRHVRGTRAARARR